MPDIFFQCGTCGKHLVVDDAGAGQTINCPECGASLTIPASQSAGSEAPATPPPTPSPKKCPECREPVDTGAVVCVNCGANLKMGTKVQASVAQPAPFVTAGQPKQNPTVEHHSESQKTKSRMQWGDIGWFAGIVFFLAFGLAIFKGCSSGSSEHRSSEHGETHRAWTDWDMGYMAGQKAGQRDRDFDNYDLQSPTRSLRQVMFGYKEGTTEYGDFWAGYENGYTEGRRTDRR